MSDSDARLSDRPVIHITLSGDIYLKSRRTQKGLVRRVRHNLEVALASAGYTSGLRRIGTHRFEIAPDREEQERIVEAASRVFGVGSVDIAWPIPFGNLDQLARSVSDVAAPSVEGKTFAVRVKRRGVHEWKSPDLGREAGALLHGQGGIVDLSNPEVTVSVTVLDDHAYVVSDHRKGAEGLPLGTQDRVLCLLSGGFDSVVAAWMLMSRGCRVDFVHFSLNCAQSDHAIAVGRELWQSWGYGTDPEVHLVEFQPVKDALFESVDARMRQVTLKVMMARAASAVAAEAGITALVTGDSLGQVSSQTLPHLVAVSNSSEAPILRPLLGLPKQSIIDLSRVVGTAELSARAQEVCDLSDGGPVATSASESQVAQSVAQLPEDVVADVVSTRKTFAISDWNPGQF